MAPALRPISLDLVGYGSSANCSEGATKAPGLTNTTSLFRRTGGCIDSGDNGADFTTGTPSPRTSATPASVCACGALDVCVNETGVASEADYCSLQFVAGNQPGDFSLALGAGATSPLVYGQLYEGGLTPGITGVVAQVGVGPLSVNPESQSGWQWFPTTQNISCSGCGANNVEFQGSFTMPVSATPGSAWAFAFRYSIDSGATWTYCDSNGAGSNPNLTFEVTKLGRPRCPEAGAGPPSARPHARVGGSASRTAAHRASAVKGLGSVASMPDSRSRGPATSAE